MISANMKDSCYIPTRANFPSSHVQLDHFEVFPCPRAHIASLLLPGEGAGLLGQKLIVNLIFSFYTNLLRQFTCDPNLTLIL